jgi:hypothetical protein
MEISMLRSRSKFLALSRMPASSPVDSALTSDTVRDNAMSTTTPSLMGMIAFIVSASAG